MSKDPHRKREAKRYENPIASREHILSTMAEIDEPVSSKRLSKELGLEERHRREALKNRLRAMVRDGQLIVDRHNVYAIASRMELVTGKVIAHADGFGFLSSENREEDIFLSNRQMRCVFHGDVAHVRIRGRDRRGRSEGEIVEVLERNTLQVVAQQHAKSSHAAIILGLEGAFAVLGGWLILDENLSTRGLIGCGLMLSGMFLSQLLPRLSFNKS